MKVSRLVLGTVQFGMNYGVANTHGKPSYETVKEILRKALDNGITTLDTAAAYGDSEEVIGKALKDLGIQKEMTIVSKVERVPAEGDPAAFIEQSIRGSMQRLQIPVIPVMLMHTESDMCYLPQLRSMIDKGLILDAGVSMDSLAYADRTSEISCLQVPCNVMDHRFDKVFTEKHNQIFIRSVYLQGMLLMAENAVTVPELLPYRRKLEAFGMPMHELCMRYLFSLPGNVSVLTGVDTPEQLEANAKMAALGPLPADLYQKVAATVPLLSEDYIRPSNWAKRKK